MCWLTLSLWRYLLQTHPWASVGAFSLGWTPGWWTSWIFSPQSSDKLVIRVYRMAGLQKRSRCEYTYPIHRDDCSLPVFTLEHRWIQLDKKKKTNKTNKYKIQWDFQHRQLSLLRSRGPLDWPHVFIRYKHFSYCHFSLYSSFTHHQLISDPSKQTWGHLEWAKFSVFLSLILA